ncbi:MAG: ABC transporter ATP-binding protein [Chloroflexi bacterium]|nr:ABC transporter ATP-binding protein [Chloroflexota bacterium]
MKRATELAAAAPASPPAIRCFGLTKRYGTVEAVLQVDLAVTPGEVMVLLGPSGCGKTTLLRLIAGFERADAGTLAVGGQLVAGPVAWVPPEKRRVGMVFQDYALFPHLDVERNVSYGLFREPGRSQRVREVLALVGLEGLAHRMPHELSGGEQQRVALARALAPRPTVILLDEPFSNLDAKLRTRVRGEVRAILREAGATAIFVTHDQEEALFLGDRVGVMNQGRLEQVDTPERIFHRPATPFVARFMGLADFLPARVEGQALVTELGMLPRPPEVTPDKPVEVMVRPDDILIHPDESGQTVVLEKVFQGTHHLYTVRLASGTVVHSLRPHFETYPVGAHVAARIEAGHALLCFVNGQLRPIPLMDTGP